MQNGRQNGYAARSATRDGSSQIRLRYGAGKLMSRFRLELIRSHATYRAVLPSNNTQNGKRKNKKRTTEGFSERNSPGDAQQQRPGTGPSPRKTRCRGPAWGSLCAPSRPISQTERRLSATTPECLAPPTCCSVTPSRPSGRSYAAMTAADANCVRTSLVPPSMAKKPCLRGSSPAKAAARCHNGVV
jgi:hypothetical protein